MDHYYDPIKVERIFTLIFLPLLAELLFLLRLAGYKLEQGIILLFSSEEEKDKILHLICQFKGIHCTLHGTKLPSYANNQIPIVEYQPFYSQEALHRFMTCPEFLPVVFACGILPPALSDFSNIFLLEDMNEHLDEAELASMYFLCREYIKKNSSELIKLAKGVYTNLVSLDEEMATTNSSLLVAAHVINYCLMKTSCCHIPTEDLLELFQSLWLVPCSSDLEILEPLRKQLYEHIRQHQLEISFGDINKVDTELYDAVTKRTAILYDNDYYYISDSLFHDATQALYSKVSYPLIKNTLLQKGILLCDSKRSSFSTKKALLINGEVQRPRFLVISREHFDSPYHLNLVERGHIQCTSVTLTI